MRWFPYLPPLVLVIGAGMGACPAVAFVGALLVAVLLGVVELGRRYRHE